MLNKLCSSTFFFFFIQSGCQKDLTQRVFTHCGKVQTWLISYTWTTLILTLPNPDSMKIFCLTCCVRHKNKNKWQLNWSGRVVFHRAGSQRRQNVDRPRASLSPSKTSKEVHRVTASVLARWPVKSHPARQLGPTSCATLRHQLPKSDLRKCVSIN